MLEKTARGGCKDAAAPSGVSKLDDIRGGGWPEYSFGVVVGEPGSGKTTLAHQFMFANASPDRRAVYFTVLGEPAIKMLRYQQQFTFFDVAKVNGDIDFANLTDEALTSDLELVAGIRAGATVIDRNRTRYPAV